MLNASVRALSWNVHGDFIYHFNYMFIVVVYGFEKP